MPASEIAVLFRTNAQSEAYEAALAEAGVPYVVQGGERFFERPEVREAMLLLRGRGRPAAASPARSCPTVRDVLAAPAGRSTGRPPGGAARERWESLAALVGLADDLVAENPHAGPGRLRRGPGRARRRPARAHRGGRDAGVAARGQGPGVGRRLPRRARRRHPADRASPTRPEAVEEERRLLYVGDHPGPGAAALSWALARNPGASGPGRAAASSPASPRSPAPTGAARRARPAKRPKVVLEGEAGELFERLRAWRSRRRQAASVPAYVVFTDATLHAIAETRPANLRELSGLPGIGARKLELYGEDVLAAVTRLTSPDGDQAPAVTAKAGRYRRG